MIKKMYGTTVLVDEINKIVSESLSELHKERKARHPRRSHPEA
ncbi:MAG: trigger factor family protein [Marinilabiliales bacterium]|nr:trigger factor family protein [Marinilabiliales bacterium]